MARDPMQTQRGLSKAAFDRQTPERYKLAGGNPAIAAQLSTIDNRRDTLKEKARKHFAKFEETWTVKEAMGLWNNRMGQGSVQNLPTMAKQYSQNAILTEARRNVRARMTNRLTKINGIGTRMTNSVIRNVQKRSVEAAPAAKPGEAAPKKGSPTR
ncbi:hypothetical protein [Roseovarius sp.]|uniref:hypothetical protein n=1 Tax=Roseovarius sp. TaxID=1486281 RepID=UPI003A9743A4